jgi:ankyrin repeat protein
MKRLFAICLIALFGVSSLMAAADDLRLVQALKNNDSVDAKALLKQRVDVNVADVDGTTAIHYAAHHGDLELVQLLIAAGAKVRVANRYGVTPLHEASTVGNVPMMEALLKAGASPNASYGAGETPLMLAARTGNPEAVKLLLSHHADVNAAEESKGYTPLMFAAVENHPEVAKILVDRGASVNIPSVRFTYATDGRVAAGGANNARADGGLTPLMFAARQGSIEAGEVLIAAGADVNFIEPQWNFSVMNTAVYNGHYDFAAMLIAKGANVNDGSLYLAVELKNMDTYSNRPNPPEIDRTLRAGDVVKLLLDKGADPNIPFTKRPPQIQTQGTVSVPALATPLYRAVKSNDIETIKLLLAKGANPGTAIKDGSTALMLAAGGGPARAEEEEVVDNGGKADPVDVMKVLVDAGADVNASNEQQMTALHLAAQKQADRIIEYLASRGAKLDVKNKAGKTPLDLAGNPTGKTAMLIKKLMEDAAGKSLQ